jgi:hypothetical protein
MEIGFAFRTATLTSSRTVVLFSKISSWCITNHNVRITKHHDVFRAFGLVRTPLSSWIDQKFVPSLNFVGHLETAQADVRSLLEKIGAWESFGQGGWGKHGD